MRGLILNTDYDWYDFLKASQPLDEVNFWQPSGTTMFHKSPPGTPVFFKLKAPHNAIGGFGFFARASVLFAWLAWDCFGHTNGAPTRDAMMRRIAKYRRTKEVDPTGRYEIGCLMVCEPVFFEPHEWVAAPADWNPHTQVGRHEDLARGEGMRIYRECRERARAYTSLAAETTGGEKDQLPERRYGEPLLVAPRLGQGTFRIAVTEAYQRACAVTGEHSLPALDAAHIKPYAKSGEHRVSNGLLLRSDIHRLFDAGYVTITPELRFEVSSRLKDDYENGRSYYPLHGRVIRIPQSDTEKPSTEYLRWHCDNVFLS